MPNASEIIQLLIAPVVMISANGLLCLSLYNRLAAIVGRARAFHLELFNITTKISELPLDEQSGAVGVKLRQRAAAIESQSRQVLRRGVMVRNAILFILAAVLCMLLSSLSLGMALLFHGLDRVALTLFIAGVLFMILAVLMAMFELLRALDPVAAEVWIDAESDQHDSR